MFTPTQESKIISQMNQFCAADALLENPPLVDHQSIIKKEYSAALGMFYRQMFLRDMVSNFMNDGKVPVMPEDPEMKAAVLRSIDRVATKPPYILLTINPRKEVSLEMFKKKIEKFHKRVFIGEYAYAYEVRDSKAQGLHCHSLIRYTCKPYDFKRAAKSTFKDVCDVKNPYVLNFKFVEEIHLKDKYDYLLGHKKESKSESVSGSIVYRTDHGLEPIYESSIPLISCRDALICPKVAQAAREPKANEDATTQPSVSDGLQTPER